jgi:hypothetical protein
MIGDLLNLTPIGFGLVFVAVLGLWWVVTDWAADEMVDYLDRWKGVKTDREQLFNLADHGGRPQSQTKGKSNANN